jgi:hypothetical protein
MSIMQVDGKGASIGQPTAINLTKADVYSDTYATQKDAFVSDTGKVYIKQTKPGYGGFRIAAAFDQGNAIVDKGIYFEYSEMPPRCVELLARDVTAAREQENLAESAKLKASSKDTAKQPGDLGNGITIATQGPVSQVATPTVTTIAPGYINWKDNPHNKTQAANEQAVTDEWKIEPTAVPTPQVKGTEK